MQENIETPELFDASDPDIVAAAEARARRAEKAGALVVRQILSSKPGRAWLYRLLETCHVFQASYDAEPHRMYFREGERNIGRQLLTQIEQADFAQMMAMIQERGGE